MEEEKKGLWSKDNKLGEGQLSSSLKGSPGRASVLQSSLIEREKKQLEKMMAKQV